jgi:hypothetical protein
MQRNEDAQDPQQEHPIQDAHGGSMAPGLVDDTGRPVDDPPGETDTAPEPASDR